jgi:hypothetical protein
MATTSPAKIINRAPKLGTLVVGAPGDVAIMQGTAAPRSPSLPASARPCVAACVDGRHRLLHRMGVAVLGEVTARPTRRFDDDPWISYDESRMPIAARRCSEVVRKEASEMAARREAKVARDGPDRLTAGCQFFDRRRDLHVVDDIMR